MSKRLDELARRAAQVLDVDPDEDDALALPVPRAPREVRASCAHGAQYDCQKLRTTTLPRSEARLSVPVVSTRGRVNRARPRSCRRHVSGDVAAARVREVPDEQPEQPETTATAAICAARLIR